MATAVLNRKDVSTHGLTTTARQWLVSPWFDALLVANVAWPIVLLMQWPDGFAGHAGLKFWQVYFVTTPHRWITLAIVFLDRERFRQNRAVFLRCLFAVIGSCSAISATTGSLTCLLAVDYIWNAWHFAAQHHGIYRIYGRITDPSASRAAIAERWILRLFVLYVMVRVAIATWSDPVFQPIFESCDWLAPAAPIALIIRDITRRLGVAIGRLLYLSSVSALYLSLLWAVHMHKPALVLSLTTASALFHALEYLSIVSWSVQNRDQTRHQQMGWLGLVASKWLLTLSVFLILLGAGAWHIDQYWRREWLFLNVIAAFLHYAYDGVIWRHRPAIPQPLA